MTQTPPLLLRRYPSPSPFATRTNVGLIDTGISFSRAERVSRVDERIDLAMLYPAFISPTCANKGKRRRTLKSRKYRSFSLLEWLTTYVYVRDFALSRRTWIPVLR